ncbi:MAG: ankyrin repeat domain-containing protein [Verrucomicrobia bacterium]|nr:ankyrin repeat domain-containing protein [Verrucomicrobiota bacterium]
MMMTQAGTPPNTARQYGGFAARTQRIPLCGLLVLVLVGLAGGCGDPKETARKKLAALNLAYKPDSFVEAAGNGDAIAVKLFLDAGMEPDADSIAGHTALSQAVVRGQPGVVNLLLERGANPNLSARVSGGLTPLMLAAGGRDTEILKALLGKGGDPDAACTSGDESFLGLTPLIIAAGRGTEDAVSVLLPRTKNINAKNSQGDTAFDVALEAGRTNILTMLRQAGAIVLTDSSVSIVTRVLADKVAADFKEAGTSLNRGNVLHTLTNGLSELKGKYGFSDEQMGVARKKITDGIENVIRLSAYRGLSIKSDEEIRRDKFLAELYRECKTRLEGPSAFLTSVCKGDLDKVKAYLAAGADANARDTNGISALMFASGEGRTEIARVLIANGAAVNDRTSDGQTALMFAKNADVAKLLLDKGAASDAITPEGVTTLAAAAARGNADLVGILLGQGLRMDATNIHGRTPLAVAARNGRTNSVRVLLDKGANREIRDEKGLTAYDYALRGGHTGIVEMLKRTGDPRQEH